MRYKHSSTVLISLVTAIIFLMGGSSVFAQTGGDCGLGASPTAFQERVDEVFAEVGVPQLFYTDTNLQKVQQSLDTFCCRSSSISADECATKTLYPDTKTVIQSPYYLDHFRFIWHVVLRGDMEVCSEYGIDCFTRIDEKNGYPGQSLCFRFGEDADPRCQSLYDVGSGVDVLSTSSKMSSPGNYRSLYETFWSDTNNILIPQPDKAKDMTPDQLTMMHMGRYMCNEIDLIYTDVLQTNTTSDQSFSPLPGSTLQKCQTAVLMDYKSHSLDYVQTLSLAKGVDQMTRINTQSREHVVDVLDDIRKTMITVKSTMTNMLRKFPEFTNSCSI